MQPDPVDGAIAALAARQHGVVEYRQLRNLGLSRQAIDHRVQAGRLHRIHRGVYAVGHKRLTQRGRWMAAVFAGGKDAVLSHRSAAALWQILPAKRGIHITTPRDLKDRDAIEFHSQSLQLDEVTIHDGIPTTTVARTLLDIAATDADNLERAFNEAEYRRLWDATGVRQLLDCCWPEARAIVELDSRAAHDTTSRFDSDRERDRLLALAGWRVVRVTWRHVTDDGPKLAADLRALIA